MRFPAPDAPVEGADTKEEAKEGLAKEAKKLAELQVKFFADSRFALLIVLQGMDTSGKDGAIRHVFGGLDQQGVRVAAFKRPAGAETQHDFLWRVHAQAPRRGEIVLFNRSHYEDVLVPRARGQMDDDAFARRLRHVNAFEQLLADEGTVIVKFFLHLSLEEQRRRLLARLEDPSKRWKFDPSDLDDRKRWASFEDTYRRVLRATDRPHAPWHVLPADRKWSARLEMARVVRKTLQALPLRFPVIKDEDGKLAAARDTLLRGEG